MSGIFKPLFGAQLNRDHPLARGLVGSWLMNERTGLAVYDYSGRGNNGVLTNFPNPSTADLGWFPGIHGGALKFTSSGAANKRMQVPTLNDTGFPQLEGSLVMMFDTIFSTQNEKHIFDFFDNRSHFYARCYTAGIQLRALNDAGGVEGGGNYPTPDGKTFLVLTYKTGVINFLNVYINNVLTADTIDDTAWVPDDQIFDIGRTLEAKFETVSLYDRALSAQEISYLGAFPYCMYEPPPIWLLKGADVGDTLTAADGFEFSDSIAIAASAGMGLSDSFELSDSVAIGASGNMSMSDGMVFSDSFSGLVSALMNLSDTTIFSDTDQSAADAGMSLSDTMEFSDSFDNTVAALLGLSDSFEFSDTAQNTAALLMTLADTAVFADIVSLQSGNFMNLSDAFELSDSFAGVGTINLTLSDGFTFSDAISQVTSAIMGLEDGFVLSDTASLSTGELVEGPVIMSVSVKQSKFDIVIKKSGFDIETKQSKFDIEVN